jgi:hypothetical protein
MLPPTSEGLDGSSPTNTAARLARSGSTASPCRDRVLHVAAFGYTLLEIVPLSLSRGSPVARWLRGVRLDGQRTTGLGELCADRGCPV